MYIRTFSRVLAAAVSATWAMMPTPSIGASLTCTGSTFSASADSSGNIVVSCTQPGSTPTGTPPGGTTPPPSGTPPSGTPGSTDVASACAAAGYSSVQPYEMGWANFKLTTKGFNITNVAVFHFRTPPNIAPGATGKISGVEFGGGARKRHAVLSTSPCDFAEVKGASIWGPFMYADNGNPTVFFTVGGTPTTAANAISPNTDYYFNVKNDPIACSPGANCDMFMELSKPLGL